MSITPAQKTSLLVVALLIVGGAAFVYFDPLDLDLLGMKPAPIAKPEPAVQTAAAKPTAVPAANPIPAKAPVAPLNPPKPVAPPAPAAVPVVVVATVTNIQQAMPSQKKAEMKPVPVKTESKPERPKNLDLRHCLDLDTNAAITKCAGE